MVFAPQLIALGADSFSGISRIRDPRGLQSLTIKAKSGSDALLDTTQPSVLTLHPMYLKKAVFDFTMLVKNTPIQFQPLLP
jgi:hypothetical protein